MKDDNDTWLYEQGTELLGYLDTEGVPTTPNPVPAWTFPPYVAVWEIADGWAINGQVPTFHDVGSTDVLRSPRDAARYFARRFRTGGQRLLAAGQHVQEAQSLVRLAEALLTSVQTDEGWPVNYQRRQETAPGSELAYERAEALMNGPLFDGRTIPEFGHAIHIASRQEQIAPCGPFFGLYPVINLRAASSLPRLYDALAQRLLEIETEFAPLVAYRVQYAAVVFGLNFGTPTEEIEAERQADEMRVRHPELSASLDEYGAKGTFLLPMHFVDDTDTPFTAHPCTVRDPSKAYTAEETYFNCRDQPFHKQMEASQSVSMRLIAGSIAPDVIEEGRAALGR